MMRLLPERQLALGGLILLTLVIVGFWTATQLGGGAGYGKASTSRPALQGRAESRGVSLSESDSGAARVASFGSGEVLRGRIQLDGQTKTPDLDGALKVRDEATHAVHSVDIRQGVWEYGFAKFGEYYLAGLTLNGVDYGVLNPAVNFQGGDVCVLAHGVDTVVVHLRLEDQRESATRNIEVRLPGASEGAQRIGRGFWAPTIGPAQPFRMEPAATSPTSPFLLDARYRGREVWLGAEGGAWVLAEIPETEPALEIELPVAGSIMVGQELDSKAPDRAVLLLYPSSDFGRASYVLNQVPQPGTAVLWPGVRPGEWWARVEVRLSSGAYRTYEPEHLLVLARESTELLLDVDPHEGMDTACVPRVTVRAIAEETSASYVLRVYRAPSQRPEELLFRVSLRNPTMSGGHVSWHQDLPALKPGTYRFEVPGLGLSVTETFAPQENAEVLLEGKALALVYIWVNGLGGKPLENPGRARVVAREEGKGRRGVHSRYDHAKGYIQLQLQPGRYEISVYGDGLKPDNTVADLSSGPNDINAVLIERDEYFLDRAVQEGSGEDLKMPMSVWQGIRLHSLDPSGEGRMLRNGTIPGQVMNLDMLAKGYRFTMDGPGPYEVKFPAYQGWKPKTVEVLLRARTVESVRVER